MKGSLPGARATIIWAPPVQDPPCDWSLAEGKSLPDAQTCFDRQEEWKLAYANLLS